MAKKETQAKELTLEEALEQIDVLKKENEELLETVDEQNAYIAKIEKQISSLEKGEKICLEVEVDGKVYQIFQDKFFFKIKPNLRGDRKNRYDSLIEKGLITQEMLLEYGNQKTVTASKLAENPDLAKIFIELGIEGIKLLKHDTK